MLSENFKKELYTIMDCQLNDNLLEPIMGQEKEECPDLEYFGQKQAPTKEQVNAIEVTASIISYLCNEHLYTDEQVKDNLFMYHGIVICNGDVYQITKQEIINLINDMDDSQLTINCIGKSVLCEWIASKISNLADNDQWDLLDNIYAQFNNYIEQLDDTFSVLTNPTTLNTECDMAQLKQIKSWIDDELKELGI